MQSELTATMPAGREMDLIIARAFELAGVCIEPRQEWRSGFVDEERPFWRYNGGLRQRFEPSKDIDAAMLVLCKARGESGFKITGGETATADPANAYRCELSGGRVGFGDTISLAICRAALAPR